MNLEFPIFPTVKRNFKFSFKFFFFLLFFITYACVLRRRFSIMHVFQVPFTSNISQKFLTFFLEVFRSRLWYFSRNLFKDLFHFLLIGTTTPRKIVCQNIDPSFFEFNNDTNRNKINCIRIVCYGSSTTKCCCIS